MSFWNSNEPLGLPRGTVRAIVVLLFGIAVVFPIFKFAAYQQEIPQTVKEVMLVLVGGLQAIVSKYFEIREKSENGHSQLVVRKEEEVPNGLPTT